MKKILAVITFFFLISQTYAEEPSLPDRQAPEKEESSIFELSGEVRVKQFLINDEPDQIKLDYRGNDDHADEEIGLVANAAVCKYFHIKAYPYFWVSRENQISRVGLDAEAKISAFFLGDELNERFRIGYGHHSWHNADAKFKGVGGKSKDWLFAEIDFLKLKGPGFLRGDEWQLKFQLKPKLFVNNREPSAIKELYSREESCAFAALELPIDFTYDNRAELHLKPFWMFSEGSDRYGITAELDVKIYKGIWVFADAGYTRAGTSDRKELGLGLMLRFK